MGDVCDEAIFFTCRHIAASYLCYWSELFSWYFGDRLCLSVHDLVEGSESVSSDFSRAVDVRARMVSITSSDVIGWFTEVHVPHTR